MSFETFIENIFDLLDIIPSRLNSFNTNDVILEICIYTGLTLQDTDCYMNN